jgi:hypothetical protein
MHRASGRFWNLFANLPESVQAVSRKNFELLKDDPLHPSLHFKKVGNLWSVRAGLNHRGLARISHQVSLQRDLSAEMGQVSWYATKCSDRGNGLVAQKGVAAPSETILDRTVLA